MEQKTDSSTICSRDTENHYLAEISLYSVEVLEDYLLQKMGREICFEDEKIAVDKIKTESTFSHEVN